MANEPKLFQVERDGPVIIWKYNNPPKNLGNPEMIAELIQLQNDLINNPELRVGIFTSALPDVFIQHWDVSNLVDRGETLLEEPAQEPPPRRVGFQRGSKPVIAAINAPTAGFGCEFVLSLDFRFMASNASIAQPEVGVGILAGGGGTQRMPRLIGIAKSLELQLTGRRVFADEAERIGLITKACDPLQLMTETIAFAKEIATRPPLAVHHIRQAINEGMSMPLEDGLALESKLMAELMKSEDALNLMRAYVATGQNSERFREELEREQ
jgi:enoyl-CoA hydratase